MVDYNSPFPDFQYRKIAETAVAYYQENPKTQLIPFIQVLPTDSQEYTHIDLTDPDVSQGVLEWSEKGKMAEIDHEGQKFDLRGLQMHLWTPKEQIPSYQSDKMWLADKNRAKLAKFASDMDNAFLHGVLADGIQLHEGFLGQANCVEDLALDDTDSVLTGATDVYHAMNKMIDQIPFEMRESAPAMLCYVSENLASKLIDPGFMTQTYTQWELVKKNLQAENAMPSRKIGQFVVTNKILCQDYDDTSGTGADETDTKGTHDRILMIVPDDRYVARLISRAFDRLGEENSMFYNHQVWGSRFRGAVFDSGAVQLSEQITWA